MAPEQPPPAIETRVIVRHQSEERGQPARHPHLRTPCAYARGPLQIWGDNPYMEHMTPVCFEMSHQSIVELPAQGVTLFLLGYRTLFDLE